MAELKGYTCDAGCGATTVVDNTGGLPFDHLGRHGWFHLFTPPYGQFYACSPECVIALMERFKAEKHRFALPEGRRWLGWRK